jgi:hypothetical protein
MGGVAVFMLVHVSLGVMGAAVRVCVGSCNGLEYAFQQPHLCVHLCVFLCVGMFVLHKI